MPDRGACPGGSYRESPRMGSGATDITGQSPLADSLDMLGFAYLALVGVAAVRDRAAPRMAFGLSLLAAASAATTDRTRST